LGASSPFAALWALAIAAFCGLERKRLVELRGDRVRAWLAERPPLPAPSIVATPTAPTSRAATT